MIYGKKTFESINDVENYVRNCEKDFEKRLEETVSKAISSPFLHLIGLSGPTCSGKTTTAKKMTDMLKKAGKNVIVISIDDFFYDKDVLQAKAEKDPNVEIDYDSEETIDFEELERCTSSLLAGDTVRIPKFDFKLGKRSGYTEIDPDEKNIYIFEGIQVVYPKVAALIGKYNCKTVYISVEDSIDMDGTVFSPEEIRLIRRTVRDFNFRGALPDFTFYLWKSVRINEDKSILPNKSNCDYTINSAMGFEINLFVPYIIPLLETIRYHEAYGAQAGALLEKLNGIQPISKNFLHENSLYYEFLKTDN